MAIQINKAFCIGLIQPKDRDYNKKNKPREEHIEIFRGGVSPTLRTQNIPVVIIKEIENNKSGIYPPLCQD